MEKELKKEIDELANKILESSGVYREYSDTDLANSLIIFMEVFMAKMYDRNVKLKIVQKERLELAELSGTKIRELVNIFTGVDMHDVFKK